MKIRNITLSNKDMAEAVELFLKSKGIIVPIQDVDKNYSGKEPWEATVAEPEEPVPAIKLTEESAV